MDTSRAILEVNIKCLSNAGTITTILEALDLFAEMVKQRGYQRTILGCECRKLKACRDIHKAFGSGLASLP
jgi:hypothetical protein